MGYIESELPPLFCVATVAVKDMVKNNLTQQDDVKPHHLEKLADTPPPRNGPLVRKKIP